jgi:hypothetical protein
VLKSILIIANNYLTFNFLQLLAQSTILPGGAFLHGICPSRFDGLWVDANNFCDDKAANYCPYPPRYVHKSFKLFPHNTPPVYKALIRIWHIISDRISILFISRGTFLWVQAIFLDLVVWSI